MTRMPPPHPAHQRVEIQPRDEGAFGPLPIPDDRVQVAEKGRVNGGLGGRHALHRVVALFGVQGDHRPPVPGNGEGAAGGRIVGAGDLARALEGERETGHGCGVAGLHGLDAFHRPEAGAGHPGDGDGEAPVGQGHAPGGARHAADAAQGLGQRDAEQSDPFRESYHGADEQPRRQTHAEQGEERSVGDHGPGQHRRRRQRGEGHPQPRQGGTQVAALPGQQRTHGHGRHHGRHQGQEDGIEERWPHRNLAPARRRPGRADRGCPAAPPPPRSSTADC